MLMCNGECTTLFVKHMQYIRHASFAIVLVTTVKKFERLKAHLALDNSDYPVKMNTGTK